MHPALIFIGVIGYYALISFLSHIPGDALANLGWNIWDKALHFVEYMPLGLLLALGMNRPPLQKIRSKVVPICLLFVFSLGALDEFHQSFIPGRFATWTDVAADTLGGALGVVIGTLYSSLIIKR
ncbi:MAG: hypothetical protein GY847_31000 [Proteobacteria bacterium]|nr:hypothetical protein [Pseudomonadota bacterium]